jgi:alkylation response protein AidB-like acyl-CoA dehydrogenase
MNLERSSEYLAFAEEVAEFLAAEWRPAPRSAAGEEQAYVREFRRRATDKGYLYRGFPRRYGGSEQAPDALRAQIIREAFERARAPMEVTGNGVTMVAPTLLERGADWQKDDFIPATLAGDMRWAQGYSEPNAGSDLASLKTTGELRGGGWIITGHKIWTTRAYDCTHMFALVRTEPDAPKHQGISYLLIDLDQPGVRIRPIRQISGKSEFCEVFLDEVRTPENWIVGARGQGWDVSRTTLKHERTSIGGVRTLKLYESLVRLAQTEGQIADPDIRERILAVEGHVRAQMFSGFYQMTCEMRGEGAGVYGLMNKLAATEIGKEIASIASDILEDGALNFPGTEAPRSSSRWLDQIFGSLGLSIAGGTSNIQRNVIAERGLGLPRSEAR